MPMKRLDIDAEKLLDIINNNEIVGQGFYGIVYKLNDEELFKFQYKDFSRDFSVEAGKWLDISSTIRTIKATNKTLRDVCHIENPNEGIEALIALQDKIKLTKLTKGLVFVDDVCVGYLLHYHKNMVNILDYCKTNTISDNFREQIIDKIKKAAKELFDNGIFPGLTVANTLINPKTNEVQLVDFEDEMTLLRESRPEMLYRSGATDIKEIEMFMSKHKPNKQTDLLSL